MKSLILIVLGLWASWTNIDLESEAIRHAVVAPVMFAIFAAWGAGWLVARLRRRGRGREGASVLGLFGDFDGGGGE